MNHHNESTEVNARTGRAKDSECWLPRYHSPIENFTPLWIKRLAKASPQATAGVSTPPGKGRFGWSKTRVIALDAMEQPMGHAWLGEWVGEK